MMGNIFRNVNLQHKQKFVSVKKQNRANAQKLTNRKYWTRCSKYWSNVTGAKDSGTL